jgi:hypothetical protein
MMGRTLIEINLLASDGHADRNGAVMRGAVFAVLLFLAPAHAAAAEALVTLGFTPNGDEILVDRSSLQTLAASELRSFPATRVRAVQRVAARRGQPARQERLDFSFDCARRLSVLLAYQNGRAGTRRQDWRGADSQYRYAPPRPGSIAETAMAYACSGGKLPVIPAKPADDRADDAGPESNP